MIEYENYHAHSYYSNPLTQPDSCAKISDYANIYRERGMKCLILSLHGNRSNVWEQFSIANNGDKLIPLAAALAYFVPNRKENDNRNFHLILVAKNMNGLYLLNLILSEANLNGFYYKARVDFELLGKINPNNFICTTACVGGVLKDELNGLRYVHQLHEIFRDNFYLLVQHHPQLIQVKHNNKILSLYRKYHYPLIYGTDSHYINSLDDKLRTLLLLSAKINNGYLDQFNLSLPTALQAMQSLLNQNVLSKAQIELAMTNTLIFRDFEGVSFTTLKKIPNSRKNLSEELRIILYKTLVCKNYKKKQGTPSTLDKILICKLMNAVTDTGTADYFIAMKDIVDKGIQYGGVLTSTGRGSGVSFATNYALGFTSINRLKCPVKLYPERFTSKDRLASGALPDLDLNMANVPAFLKAGKLILGLYGCLPMIAFGTNKTLQAFKLLARARNIDFETANEVASQIKKYLTSVKYALLANADDPLYDIDNDVRIEDYVDEQYTDLIEESKQYRGIVTTMIPHPCAHLLLDKDIRRLIGVIRCKSKSGNKDVVYAAYIDGTTADAYGYLKADYLRVDVVKLIDAGFKAVGRLVPSVDELLNLVSKDRLVWNLYEKGYTIGLNQCEKLKTTERVMRYKPKNVVELAAFVAAVRPGFKSMLLTFISRTPFSYDIPSLDKILQTKLIPSSFLMYDLQILSILQAGGISASLAYACIKAIKKKKAAKVASYGLSFREGFTKHLIDDEGKTFLYANEVVDKIWTIINDAASYMFCSAHAFSMACDSLYCAYLKAHYPYEFYVTMLKLYDEKGNKEKIAQIITLMKKYKGIKLKVGALGLDNRNWLINKENKTISQSLSGIKYMSKVAAEQLFTMKYILFDSFTDVLHFIQTKTSVNTRQIEILIKLGYFNKYGKGKTLLHIFDVYNNGNEKCKKITKSLVARSLKERLSILKAYELELPNIDLGIKDMLNCLYEHMGLCLYSNKNAPDGYYYVMLVDSTYGVKVKLYNVKSGNILNVRVRKNIFLNKPILAGKIIAIKDSKCIPKYSSITNKSNKKNNKLDLECWLMDYEMK